MLSQSQPNRQSSTTSHSIPNQSIPAQSNRSVELMSVDGNITKVTAWLTNPNERTWMDWFINKFSEWFLAKKTTIMVKVGGNPNDMYMRIDDVSKALGISSDDLRLQLDTDHPNNERLIISKLNQRNIMSLITSLSGRLINQNEAMTIARYVPLSTIRVLVNHYKLDSKKMASTLIEIGKRLDYDIKARSFKLIQESESQDEMDDIDDIVPHNKDPRSYKFSLNNDELEIETDHETRIKVNLKTRAVTEIVNKDNSIIDLKSPEGQLALENEAKKEFDEINDSKDVKNAFAQLDGIARYAPGKTEEYQGKLAERIGYQAMVKMVKEYENVEEKAQLLRTFTRIGEVLSQNHDFNTFTSYFKKEEKGWDNQVSISHAFAITPTDIYINRKQLSSQGNNKIVSSAIKINQSNFIQKYVRLKPKMKIKNNQGYKVYYSQQTQQTALKNFKKESDNLDLLRGIPEVVSPHSLTSATNRMRVHFQIAYSMDGQKLKGKPIRHQLGVLRDCANALAKMHGINLVHGDVKPDQFMVLGDLGENEPPAQGKLGDLGSIRRTDELMSQQASPAYVPAECVIPNSNQFRNRLAHTEQDAFSFGVSLSHFATDIITIKDMDTYARENNLLGTNQFNTKYINNNTFRGPLFYLLDQNEIDTYFKWAKSKLQEKNPPDLEHKIELLNISRQLVKVNAEERMTLAETAKKLDNLLQKVLSASK